MATKINYRNIPRFLLLLLGAMLLSLIMQERLNLSRPMGATLGRQRVALAMRDET
jgi:hypothetical protein